MKFKREFNTRGYRMSSPEELKVKCRFCGAKEGEECRNAEYKTRSAHMRRRDDARRLREFAATVTVAVVEEQNG